MKRTLEQKDIQFYPSDKLLFNFADNSDRFVINKIDIRERETYLDLVCIDRPGCRSISDKVNIPLSILKPLLIPMSHLTKPMRVEGYNNGNEFVPLEMLSDLDIIDRQSYLNEMENNRFVPININILIGYCMFSGDQAIQLFQFLAMWHFDFQGLIMEGLALDKTKHI